MKSLFSKEKWQQLFYTVSHPCLLYTSPSPRD